MFSVIDNNHNRISHRHLEKQCIDAIIKQNPWTPEIQARSHSLVQWCPTFFMLGTLWTTKIVTEHKGHEKNPLWENLMLKKFKGNIRLSQIFMRNTWH
jgi:hypothetical protein